MGKWNHLARTLVYAGMVGLLGWGALEIRGSLKARAAELAERDEKIGELQQDVATRDRKIGELDRRAQSGTGTDVGHNFHWVTQRRPPISL